VKPAVLRAQDDTRAGQAHIDPLNARAAELAAACLAQVAQQSQAAAAAADQRAAAVQAQAAAMEGTAAAAAARAMAAGQQAADARLSVCNPAPTAKDQAQVAGPGPARAQQPAAGLSGGQDDRRWECLRDVGVDHAQLWRAEHVRLGRPAASRSSALHACWRQAHSIW